MIRRKKSCNTENSNTGNNSTSSNINLNVVVNQDIEEISNGTNLLVYKPETNKTNYTNNVILNKLDMSFGNIDNIKYLKLANLDFMNYYTDISSILQDLSFVNIVAYDFSSSSYLSFSTSHIDLNRKDINNNQGIQFINDYDNRIWSSITYNWDSNYFTLRDFSNNEPNNSNLQVETLRTNEIIFENSGSEISVTKEHFTIINKTDFPIDVSYTTITNETMDLSNSFFNEIIPKNNSNILVNINVDLYCSYALEERITIELWKYDGISNVLISTNLNLGSINGTGGLTIPYNLTYLDQHNIINSDIKYYLKYKLENNNSQQAMGLININNSRIILRELPNT